MGGSKLGIGSPVMEEVPSGGVGKILKYMGVVQLGSGGGGGSPLHGELGYIGKVALPMLAPL